MARRKHHAKKTTHRRRRRHGMGAISSHATNALAIIAGGVAARLVSNTVAGTMTASGTAVSQTTKYVAAAAPIALGMFMPRLIKSSFGAGLGSGMIAVGGLGLAQTFGLPGIAGMPQVAGYKKRVGLAPTNQNPRGAIAGTGMSTHQASMISN